MVRSGQSWVSVGESSLMIMLISHVLQDSVTQTQSNQRLHPVSQPNNRGKSPVLVVSGHGTQSLVMSQRALN